MNLPYHKLELQYIIFDGSLHRRIYFANFWLAFFANFSISLSETFSSICLSSLIQDILTCFAPSFFSLYTSYNQSNSILSDTRILGKLMTLICKMFCNCFNLNRFVIG